MDDLIQRLRLDIIEIRTGHPRTGKKTEVPVRWTGQDYRRMKDLADDLEELLDGYIGPRDPFREDESDSDAEQPQTDRGD
jgi:hypothetical protein